MLSLPLDEAKNSKAVISNVFGSDRLVDRRMETLLEPNEQLKFGKVICVNGELIGPRGWVIEWIHQQLPRQF